MKVKTTLILFCICLKSFSQESGLVNWLSFEEAEAKYKQVPKPLLIDFYTDWCGWCKHMIKTTYSNPNIAGYINQNFYPVKFNAETKDTIVYQNKKYYPTSTAPKTPHELTIKFLGNSLSYPSTIFVTNNFEFNLVTQGFLEEKKLEPVMIFILENVYKRCPYEEFSTQFERTFYDTVFPKIPVKSYSIQEAIALTKKKPKKILINIYTNFCNSCKVQNKTSFVDTSIANYLNKNFYLVNFDAESNDTIVYAGEKYYKQMINGYPLNSFAFKITNGSFALPSISVLDEKANFIEVLPMYQHPKNLKPILYYFGTNTYKTKKWNEFYETYNKSPAIK